MEPVEFDFKRDVVDLSFEKPILIDFWAEWCGPCRVLGPVIEELEKEYKGIWSLVKINTEEHQDIAAYFRIQSIPNCKLIYQGKLVDEFAGALSKATIKTWLDKQLAALEIETEPDMEPDDFDTLLPEFPSYPDQILKEKLKRFLELNQDHKKALIEYYKQELFDQPMAVIEALHQFKDQKEFSILIEDSPAIAEWLQLSEGSEIANRNLITARNLILNQQAQESIDLIIETVMKFPSYQNELARRIGITLFHFWGNQHPLTKENRKLFDMAIY